jgi:hypothetical protein
MQNKYREGEFVGEQAELKEQGSALICCGEKNDTL